MNVQRVANEDQLTALAPEWDCLAHGVPFRRWDWVRSWWRTYSSHRELFVLTVRDERGQLVGIAPWYTEKSGAQGRILAFLGSGEVCSDYLTVLSTKEHETVVAQAVADWLSAAAHAVDGTSENRWDLLELEGVLAEDSVVRSLLDHMADGGCAVHRREEDRCWRIILPDSLQGFLARLSKSRAKQARRLLDELEHNKGLVFQKAGCEQDPERGLDILIDLHQRRRQSLGQPGCFACKQFTEFVRDSARRLHAAGELELCWLELNGHPVAIDLNVVTDEAIYAYQSGIEPDALDCSPGHLLFMAVIRDAIASNRRIYDFLRGDEAYKSHWRGESVPLIRVRVIPARAVPRLRHGVWLAGVTMKNLLKTGRTTPGTR
ncbi:MAG: GNAT family N-acetyltransferase [Pirellulaceae bacterium]